MVPGAIEWKELFAVKTRAGAELGGWLNDRSVVWWTAADVTDANAHAIARHAAQSLVPEEMHLEPALPPGSYILTLNPPAFLSGGTTQPAREPSATSRGTFALIVPTSVTSAPLAAQTLPSASLNTTPASVCT